MTNLNTHSAVVDFRTARRMVDEYAQGLRPTGLERIPLLQSTGRVLAEAIRADRDLPPFSRATRDGFALRAADVQHPPVELHVIAEIRAGALSPESLPQVKPGEAVEIMTGAPVPPGADAVLMVEYTQRQGAKVSALRTVSPGENIVPRAAEAQSGAVLLPAGMRLDYAAIAVAASVGICEPAVYRRPRVCVISTGDEVVEISVQPGPHQIRNSNSYSLAAQILAAGGEPQILSIAPDEPKRLHELLAQGLDSDLLLLSGGVSMGKYDVVEQALAKFGARFQFTGVLMQPGKPLVFGDAARPGAGDARERRTSVRTPFFGLPGNPVSTMVTFEIFARPVIAALSGALPGTLRLTFGKLNSPIKTKTGLTRFLPAVLSGAFNECVVELAPWHGSGDIVATARANCYIVVPPDREHIADGEYVAVMLRGVEI
ncbi:MAG TPA: gephyrin-like molybdotransferase Glp [Clostridia bacterium]|nr:gephyrin-like molybdotransferase Glp [Clostridia bacterium]